jgi:hypothetical protein
LSLSFIVFTAASRAKEEVHLKRLLGALSVTIALAGASHLLEFWLARAGGPPSWLMVSFKLVTGLAAVATAAFLPPLIPKLAEILKAAEESVAREEELSNAYHELGEVYRKATQPARERRRSRQCSKPPVGSMDLSAWPILHEA